MEQDNKAIIEMLGSQLKETLEIQEAIKNNNNSWQEDPSLKGEKVEKRKRGISFSEEESKQPDVDIGKE